MILDIIELVIETADVTAVSLVKDSRSLLLTVGKSDVNEKTILRSQISSSICPSGHCQNKSILSALVKTVKTIVL